MSLSPKAPRGAYFRSLVQTDAPEAQPIDAAFVGSILGYGDELPATEVTLIDTMIPAAVDAFEDITGQSLINQGWRLETDGIPGGREPWWDGVAELPISELYGWESREITIPRWPLVEVFQVSLFDENDNETLVDPSIYYVDTARKPGRIMLRRSQVWPSVIPRVGGAFQVTFEAGYGDTAETVPADIKYALGSMVAYMYEHRGCDAQGAVTKSGALSTINRYRLTRL